MTIDDVTLRRFDSPDEVRTFEKGRFELVRVGGSVIGRATYQPGWRWSTHVGAPIGIAHRRHGQYLERDIALKARLARAIHLAHSACPERADYFVRADVSARGQRHARAVYSDGLSRRAVQKRRSRCAFGAATPTALAQVEDRLPASCRECHRSRSSYSAESRTMRPESPIGRRHRRESTKAL